MHFSFPTRPGSEALSGIDLTIEPGEVVAFVGRSGAGKSSLLYLLLRFYDPSAGRILLDGIDTRRLDPSWLRGQIGIVLQEPVLFSRSIADNIRYGRADADDRALRAAAAIDFDRQPPHVRRLATCAWKPIAIDEVMTERGGLVLWLDSATIVQASLEPIFARIAREGVLALAGQSPISRWCHSATLRFMHVPGDDTVKRCRSAVVLGFDAGRRMVRALVADWRAFALVEGCIDPPGASRANHRHGHGLWKMSRARDSSASCRRGCRCTAPRSRRAQSRERRTRAAS